MKYLKKFYFPMNKIPIAILPRTLRRRIILPNVSKIEVEQKRKSTMILSTIIFMKKFGPIIKFHNETLEFQRVISDRTVPLITIYGKDNSKLDSFEPGNLTVDEIVKKVRDADPQGEDEVGNKNLASMY